MGAYKIDLKIDILGKPFKISGTIEEIEELDEEISNPEREAATKVTTEAPVCKKCLRMKTKPDVIGRMYNCKSTKSPNYGKLQCNGRVGDLWLNHLI